MQEIGRDLGVTYVVEGSIRRAGKRVRCNVQLVEAGTGNHVWAERYDRETVDIFDLQDEITRSIVAVLPLRLQGALVERTRKKPSESLSAYECFLQAQWLSDNTSSNGAKSLDLLATAIRIDPNFARAHALTASILVYSVFTFSPIGADPTIAARKSITTALALGDNDPLVHVLAAQVFMISGEHDLAQVHIDKALAMNPNDFIALIEQGTQMNYAGNPSAAVEYLKRALAHDPLAPDHQYECLAEANYMARNYVEAAKLYERWRNPPVHMYTHLAACYAQLGRMDDCRRAALQFETARPAELRLCLLCQCACPNLQTAGGRQALARRLSKGGPVAVTDIPVDRRLAAILVADVVGFSRLMAADEAGTLAALRERRRGIVEPVVHETRRASR